MESNDGETIHREIFPYPPAGETAEERAARWDRELKANPPRDVTAEFMASLPGADPIKTGYESAHRSRKYRKLPVVIEAAQWFENGDHPHDNSVQINNDVDGDSFLSEGAIVRRYRHPDDPGERSCQHCGRIMHDHGWIDTLEGGHNVCPGDYIITGVKGEHYPCKPDIFVATYELVAE